MAARLAVAVVLLGVGVGNAARPVPLRPKAPADLPGHASGPGALRKYEAIKMVSFGYPVDGYPIISPFGLRQLPWESHGRLHEGADIAAPLGTAARAVADGVVVSAGDDGGYGRLVEIRHASGLMSRYGHLSAIAPEMAPGVAVKTGQVIGAVGSSGSSTGAHLHFEIRDSDDRPLNPAYFIGRSFASLDALPIKAAARIPAQVNIAFVSYIPESKRDMMTARVGGDKGGLSPAGAGASADSHVASDDAVTKAIAEFRAHQAAIGDNDSRPAPRRGALVAMSRLED